MFQDSCGIHYFYRNLVTFAVHFKHVPTICLTFYFQSFQSVLFPEFVQAEKSF